MKKRSGQVCQPCWQVHGRRRAARHTTTGEMALTKLVSLRWRYARCHECGRHRKVTSIGQGEAKLDLCRVCAIALGEVSKLSGTPYSENLRAEEDARG